MVTKKVGFGLMMKRWILILAFFFAIPAADAGMVIGSGAGGGATLIFSEDAEGTGTPSGWTNTNSPDWDYTGLVLAGAQSVQAADADRASFNSGAAHGEVWLRFKFRIESGSDLEYRTFSFRTQSGDAEIAYLEVGPAGGARIVSGSASAATVTAINATCSSVTCNVWLRYKKGTGANAEMSVGFSTDCIEPTSGDQFAALNTGTSTADIDRFQFRAGPGGSSVYLFDDMVGDDAALGDC